MNALVQKITKLRKSDGIGSPFIPMTALIEPEKDGKVEVDHFKVSKSDSQWTAIRGDYVPEGKYARLRVHGTLMMTDTQMEKRTNYEFVRRAHGDVLISGLGLGMIVAAVIDKVRSITVVEKYPEVIRIVSKHFPGITCICADIRDWTPPKEQRWNVIYHDIWPDVCTDNLQEIYKLERRFRKYLDRSDPERWQGSWQKAHLQWLNKRGR